ncbi:MAG TPA: hypothetical protein VFG47_18230 [Geminicoccaceae bacterium]|nr:hypothetical protein [Geminicoccaceae bacterium]
MEILRDDGPGIEGVRDGRRSRATRHVRVDPDRLGRLQRLRLPRGVALSGRALGCRRVGRRSIRSARTPS